MKRTVGYWNLLPDEVGAGGYGKVWKAIDTRTGKEVAVKEFVLRPSFCPPSIFWHKNAREVAILQHFAQYPHPNIVRMEGGYVTESGEVFIAMELHNISLREGIGNRKSPGPLTSPFPYSVERRTYHMWQLLCGVKAMHLAGVAHRDIVSKNILLTLAADPCKYRDDRLVIADLCGRPNQFYDDAGPSLVVGAADSLTVGTQTSPSCRAPEVLIDDIENGLSRWWTPDFEKLKRMDIWSAGCIMAEIVLGDYLVLPPPRTKPPTEVKNTFERVLEMFGEPSNKIKEKLFKDKPKALAVLNGLNFKESELKLLTSRLRVKLDLKQATKDEVDLLTKILRFDPEARPTIDQILQHDCFTKQPWYKEKAELMAAFFSKTDAEAPKVDVKGLKQHGQRSTEVPVDKSLQFIRKRVEMYDRLPTKGIIMTTPSNVSEPLVLPGSNDSVPDAIDQSSKPRVWASNSEEVVSYFRAWARRGSTASGDGINSTPSSYPITPGGEGVDDTPFATSDVRKMELQLLSQPRWKQTVNLLKDFVAKKHLSDPTARDELFRQLELVAKNKSTMVQVRQWVIENYPGSIAESDQIVKKDKEADIILRNWKAARAVLKQPDQIDDAFCYLDVGCGDGTTTVAVGAKLRLTPEQILGYDIGVSMPQDEERDAAYSSKYTRRYFNGKDFQAGTVGLSNKCGNDPLRNEGSDFVALSDESVDLVTMVVVLHHCQPDVNGNLGSLLKDVHRVLKSGGLFVIKEHDADSSTFFLYLEVMHTLKQRVFYANEKQNMPLGVFRPRLIPGRTHESTEPTLLSWEHIMNMNGFERVPNPRNVTYALHEGETLSDAQKATGLRVTGDEDIGFWVVGPDAPCDLYRSFYDVYKKK